MSPENQAKAQHTFDVMAAHLLTQGEKSMAVTPLSVDRVNGSCAYRGNNGNRCVVGFCIKDEKYHPCMESVSAAEPMIIRAMDNQYCKDKVFVSKMQLVHDTKDVENWPTALKAIAAMYNLDASVVDTFSNPVIPQPEILVYAD